ncbi:hypothetical protein G3N58_17580 [Paraburkholderia sp. Ac-20342]|uniref:phage baseplate plug family protein n=1 Tax=Paraburkholderia sp. Ac-20342 TaxID=2703889 RepID=UPI00197EF20A|nr:hypothetical protein [Paraburkholderia sp. Ac-20342]MBN3848619.1 hypothetical protein [Paraburkholderia sp. Ac-20342]
MTTYYEIPLSAQPQTFTIALGGTTYGFNVQWNAQNAAWTIDISDASGNAIVTGIPMVTGCNLLEQFDYLGFEFALVAQTDSSPDTVPTYDTLGTTSHLYAITA